MGGSLPPSPRASWCLCLVPTGVATFPMEVLVLGAQSVIPDREEPSAPHQKPREKGEKFLLRRKLGVISSSLGLVQFGVRVRKKKKAFFLKMIALLQHKDVTVLLHFEFLLLTSINQIQQFRTEASLKDVMFKYCPKSWQWII